MKTHFHEVLVCHTWGEWTGKECWIADCSCDWTLLRYKNKAKEFDAMVLEHIGENGSVTTKETC